MKGTPATPTTPSAAPVVAVVGGGAWGTAIAVHLAGRGSPVRLWIRERQVADEIVEQRSNHLYLPGVDIPANVQASADLQPVLTGAELVVVAVPSQYARSVYRQMAPHIAAAVPLVVAAKGIEEKTLDLPLDVAAEELGADRGLAVLSGPSFAAELARARPTAVVVASSDSSLAMKIQSTLSSRVFRLYTNDDPVGVQLAGGLKNVYAIAAGVADSLGMGLNAQSAMITRALAEMTRLGRSLGGRAATFSGLAGLGDLVLTCTGELSRNRTLGQCLGRGRKLAQIVEGSLSVAEGVRTTASARELAHRERVQMPIVDEVYRMLYEDGSPQQTLERLMSRPLTSEHDVDAERHG